MFRITKQTISEIKIHFILSYEYFRFSHIASSTSIKRACWIFVNLNSCGARDMYFYYRHNLEYMTLNIGVGFLYCTHFLFQFMSVTLFSFHWISMKRRYTLSLFEKVSQVRYVFGMETIFLAILLIYTKGPRLVKNLKLGLWIVTNLYWKLIIILFGS